jgi:hypothetical protein
MTLKQKAADYAARIEALRQKAEQANVFNMKPILEEMAALQSEFNAVVVEALPND